MLRRTLGIFIGISFEREHGTVAPPALGRAPGRPWFFPWSLLLRAETRDVMSCFDGPLRAKAVEWHDPAMLAAAAAELPGREFLQALADGRLPAPPMANLVGARLTFVGDGEVRFVCAPDESVYNTIGIVHGGFLCTMLDSAAAAAVHARLPAGVGLSSIEIKVSYLKPLRADSGEIEFHGRAIRIGRRVAFAEAHAHDPRGKLVGHATSSLAVLPRG